jgi:hypothetical protein
MTLIVRLLYSGDRGLLNYNGQISLIVYTDRTLTAILLKSGLHVSK